MEQEMKPKRFVKKPLEVVAVQVDPDNKEDISQFLGDDEHAFTDEGLLFRCDGSVVLAKWWDWVIKDEELEPYPCRASLFEQTHDPVPS